MVRSQMAADTKAEPWWRLWTKDKAPPPVWAEAEVAGAFAGLTWPTPDQVRKLTRTFPKNIGFGCDMLRPGQVQYLSDDAIKGAMVALWKAMVRTALVPENLQLLISALVDKFDNGMDGGGTHLLQR